MGVFLSGMLHHHVPTFDYVASFIVGSSNKRITVFVFVVGMKKNAYGNIEDIVVDVVVVTARGCLHQRTSAPRVSCGPSLQHLILGSEGTLGIITQVLVRVRLLPEVRCVHRPQFHYLWTPASAMNVTVWFFSHAVQSIRLFSLPDV